MLTVNETMFTVDDEIVVPEMVEKDREIGLLKMNFILHSDAAAAVERELRIRLAASENEIAHLHDRLQESEAALQQMRNDFHNIETQLLLRRESKAGAGEHIDRSSQAADYSHALSLSSSSGQVNHLQCGREVTKTNNLNEGNAVRRRNSDAHGDALDSSDSDSKNGNESENEKEVSLLIQNPKGLNASTFIPIAKKRRMNMKLSNDGVMAGTKKQHWESMFTLLLRFNAEHKHCNVPQRYKFNDSLDGTITCLGRWLQFQRISQKKNRMPPDRLARMQHLVDEGKLFWDFNMDKGE